MVQVDDAAAAAGSRTDEAVRPFREWRRYGRPALFIVALLIWLLWPIFRGTNYSLSVGSDLFLNASLALAFWPLMVTGQINMAHVAMMGIGAYVTGVITVTLGLSPWLAPPIAIVAAGLIGFALGSVTLRLRGAYFFLVSFAFLEVARLFFNGYFPEWFGGASGLPGVPRPPLPNIPIGETTINFGAPIGRWYLAGFLLLIWLVFVTRLMASQTGRVLRALGRSDSLAESVGINAFKYRLLTMVYASAFTGLAGSYYAFRTSVVQADDFGISRAVLVVVMTVVGGVGSATGPLIGAGIVTLIGEWLRGLGALRQLGYGVMLVVVMLVLPGGLISLPSRIAELWRQMRRRSQVVVPSDGAIRSDHEG